MSWLHFWRLCAALQTCQTWFILGIFQVMGFAFSSCHFALSSNRRRTSKLQKQFASQAQAHRHRHLSQLPLPKSHHIALRLRCCLRRQCGSTRSTREGLCTSGEKTHATIHNTICSKEGKGGSWKAGFDANGCRICTMSRRSQTNTALPPSPILTPAFLERMRRTDSAKLGLPGVPWCRSGQPPASAARL